MNAEPLLLKLENTVFLRGDTLVIIDRRLLPLDIKEIVCSNSDDVANAIKAMAVQGAGDIAICAGYGLLLAARSSYSRSAQLSLLQETARKLIAVRPTGFHLQRFLEKILDNVNNQEGDCAEIIANLLSDAQSKQDAISQKTGRNALGLLENGDTLLTHCFAGAGLLYLCKYAQQEGRDFKVICTETRPYLQGARLTASSLAAIGVDTTLITDNMVAHCFATGRANKVFVAADRIALDGSVANKIGTLGIAISAKHFAIPFYILAYGGPDRKTASGRDIVIEERDPVEVLAGHSLSGVKALYPAFDITPRSLVTAYITSKAIIPSADF
ncbi:MAG: s-methyl-5-thioribose-1-phosphate isomerase [Deltaproteobacteria bacterium]|nr:s-methyl-5-thioribose-1-phosphate isomerase [Deltaproteobacteria bacterium]